MSGHLLFYIRARTKFSHREGAERLGGKSCVSDDKELFGTAPKHSGCPDPPGLAKGIPLGPRKPLTRSCLYRER